MSKKARRIKKRARNLQIDSINQARIQQLMSQARTQLQRGDFEETVETCQHLLKHYLQRRTALRVDVLAYMGLAYGMMHQHQEGYNAFTEAASIDPTNAEIWYDRGIASYFTTRIGQSLRDFERAFELLQTSPSLVRHREELTPKFLKELESSRQLASEALELRGPGFTLDQLIEQDEHFQRGLILSKASNWKEAEQAFRRVIAMGECLPQHSGNLAVTLLMQQRYDEAEAALKRALEFDPEYPLARENLSALPTLRSSKKLTSVRFLNDFAEPDAEQSIRLFQPGNETRPDTTSVIKKDSTRVHLGKQPPRYRLFLNPYQDARFTRCPQCGNKTRQHKLPLVIHIDPSHVMVLNKTCRYCPDCDLLIVHQDQLESLLAASFEQVKPEIIGNDYLIVGTVDRSDWKEGIQNQQTVQELFDRMHDFKEAVKFTPVGGWGY